MPKPMRKINKNPHISSGKASLAKRNLQLALLRKHKAKINAKIRSRKILAKGLKDMEKNVQRRITEENELFHLDENQLLREGIPEARENPHDVYTDAMVRNAQELLPKRRKNKKKNS